MRSIYRKTLLLVVLFTTFSFAKAQETGNEPSIKILNNEDFKFAVGGRFMADAAYYKTDYTKMNSGFAIIEGRLRSSLNYKNWLLYVDVDFVKEKVHQKNIFLRYNFDKTGSGQHSIKIGYYNEPSTMSLNTSKYNLHFFTRASTALALSPGRALGVSYKFYNDFLFLDQGVYAENKYNNQDAGSQGFSASGRWIYKPIASEDMTAHVGVTARYAQINTGVQENNILKKEINYSSFLETRVDPTHMFLTADMPWADQTLGLSAEALFHTEKFFIRGEYLLNKVYKSRPDQKLFDNQLGGKWSWWTLKSWQDGNPLRTSTFDGFYVELGYLLQGASYSYKKEYSVLNGANEKGDFEIVARYSMTNLNDISEGDFFFIGKEKFYNKVVSDYPAASTSIGGGKLQTAVIGFNYTFMKQAKVMLAYQFSNLDNVYFPNDKNFHTVQCRFMFSF